MNGAAPWMPSFARQMGRRCREIYRHRTAEVCANPVLLGGLQKSGTTAIATLLSIATGLRYSNDPLWQAHRANPRAFLFTDLLENRLSLAAFIRSHRAYFAAEIIKDPDFALMFDALTAQFPASPLVFIVRDPRQNIRSILNRLQLPGDLAELDRGQRRALRQDKSWDAILQGRGLGITEGNYIERLAQRWNAVADRYLQRRERVHLLRYEDFVANKVACIAALAGTLDLPIVADITGDQDRQYQPRGDRTAQPDRFFGAHNLALIETTCAANMAKFGYVR